MDSKYRESFGNKLMTKDNLIFLSFVLTAGFFLVAIIEIVRFFQM